MLLSWCSMLPPAFSLLLSVLLHSFEVDGTANSSVLVSVQSILGAASVVLSEGKNSTAHTPESSTLITTVGTQPLDTRC
jgi:hypothetical protein